MTKKKVTRQPVPQNVLEAIMPAWAILRSQRADEAHYQVAGVMVKERVEALKLADPTARLFADIGNALITGEANPQVLQAYNEAIRSAVSVKDLLDLAEKRFGPVKTLRSKFGLDDAYSLADAYENYKGHDDRGPAKPREWAIFRVVEDRYQHGLELEISDRVGKERLEALTK